MQNELQNEFGLPVVQAGDDNLPAGSEEDFKAFAQASKAMDALLKELQDGKYATAADLSQVSADLASIRAGMQDGYKKQEDAINERVAEAISAGNKEQLEQVRTMVGDMLKGQPAAQATADQPPGWEKVQANTRQEGRHPGPGSASFAGGRDTVVLWADIRRPQVQAAEQPAVQSAALTIAPVTGIDGVTPMAPWIYIQEGDPFMDVAMMVYPTNPTFTLPSLAKPSAPVKNRSKARTAEAVDAAGASVPADFWEKVMSYPAIREDDVIMLRDLATQNMLQMFGTTWGADVVATLKAGATTASQTVKTGEATALPDATKFPATIASVLAAVKSFYRMGASWQLNEQVEALWNSQWGASGGIDPETARGTLLGFPKRINSHLDDGSAANNISAYFGNCRMVLVEALFRDVEIRYYDQTTPGDMTLYGCLRGKSAVMNKEAFSFLNTAA